ncbi:hypothetical protein C8F01DRAFT_673534 [Mycena amicta]|nr:hypothetical protein C8F01DRAFT_673534 [Mycena amicta]
MLERAEKSLYASSSLNPGPEPPRPRLIQSLRRVIQIAALTAVLLVLALLRPFPGFALQWPARENEPASLKSADDPRLQAYQTPDDALACKELSPETQTSVSLGLPTDAALLFFLSRGPLFGQLDLSKDTSSSSDSVEVTVSTEDAYSQVQVCRMGSTSANEHGVLIWADSEHRETRVTLTVKLPHGVYFYQDLSTDLPLFVHEVDDLRTQYASFDNLRLKTVDVPINYAGLLAGSIFLQTSNANISGFSDGYELDVHTSNAAIEALARFQAEEPDQKLRLNLKTSLGPISTSLALFSPYENLVLDAHIHTSLGPILIQSRVPWWTLNSTLLLDASTSLKPISIWLDESYEGTYELETSASAVYVNQDEDVEDPLGRGRKRVVTKLPEEQEMYAKGEVY